MIPLFKVYMAPEAGTEVTKVLNSGYIGQGNRVEKFEEELKRYFDTPYVLTVNSATSGLTLAFRLVNDLMPNKDVVATTPLTCTATNWAILAADPRTRLQWIDVDKNNCNLSLDDLDDKLNKDTKAVSVVHWGGYPVDLNRLERIISKFESKHGYRPMIVEDCAHAMGSYYDRKPLGTHGNIAVYSLQAIKHITSVDGGIMVLPNEELYKKAKLLRWYGLDRDSSADFRCSQDIADWGYKFHMNDVNAAIGHCNFNNLRTIVSYHIENAKYYRHKLAGIDGIQLLEHKDVKGSGIDCAYWVFTLLAEDRDGLKRKLQSCDIMSSQVHARNDKHPCVEQFREHLPAMDEVDRKMLCIPCGWWVDIDDAMKIVDTIKSGW